MNLCSELHRLSLCDNICLNNYPSKGGDTEMCLLIICQTAAREFILPLLLSRRILMHKTMVFIDYQNFNINLIKHYNGKNFKSINYKNLSKELNAYVPLESEVIKTYLFAYKPCDELLQLESYKRYYEWLSGAMKHVPYLV